MAISNIAGSTRMEMLNGSNYDTWRIQVQAILIKNDAWPYVCGKKVKPEITGEGADLVASQAAYDNWELADSKARADIILTMCPTQLMHLRNCNTSKQVWDKLESMFASQGPARKQTLLENLLSQKFHEGTM